MELKDHPAAPDAAAGSRLLDGNDIEERAMSAETQRFTTPSRETSVEERHRMPTADPIGHWSTDGGVRTGDAERQPPRVRQISTLHTTPSPYDRNGVVVTTTGLLEDRYVLAGAIGRGGMADVFRAHDCVLDRDVAVKVLRTVAGHKADQARFMQEARILARLSHPGLVTVFDAGTSDGRPFLVMELVEGHTLSECCDDKPALGAVLSIGVQIADALDRVHAAGIVHRDIKPGNVLVDQAGRVRLIDFGIALPVGLAAGHTADGELAGTAAYLSPEQLLGKEVGPASDVYSLGLVLLEALTGGRAFPGLPIESAFSRLSTDPPIPVALPSALRQLFRGMTARDPGVRPRVADAAAAMRTLGARPAAAPGAPQVIVQPTTRRPPRPRLASFGSPVALAGQLLGSGAVVLKLALLPGITRKHQRGRFLHRQADS